MLAYLLLAGSNGAPVDPDLIARLDRDDPPEVPFHPDSRIVWRNHDSSVVFFGWQAFTEVAGIGSHWVVDDQGLTAFTGHCWPRETGWVHGTDRSWAAQLQSYLRDQPSPLAARESCFGVFTIVSVPTAGTGWVIPDWASVDQLFVADRSTEWALSNRAGLCAQAVRLGTTVPTRSLTAAGWLIGVGSILDQESGYWEVERPRAGSSILIEPGQGARVIEPARSPLYPPEPEPPAPSYEMLLDEVEHNLRTTVRALAELPLDDRVLSLSGGKDSRTLLAFMLSEGVHDRFRFETTGSPERADAIAARAIATRFGLDWSLVDLTARTAATELDNTCLYTGLTEGMTSAWSTMDRPVFSPGLTITGTAGEGLLWTRTARAGIDASSVADVVAGVRKRRPIDRLGVLRPEVRGYYDAWIDSFFDEQAAQGIPLVSLPALHRYEEFLHSRFGPDAAWSPRMRVLAYSTPTCMQINHRLSTDQRPVSRFHVDLQRRAAPELSKMPLAAWTWPEAAIAHLPDADDYRRIEPAVSQNLDGRTWRQKRYADYRPFIETILLDRDNPIQTLVDYDRLLDRIGTGDAHPGRVRHLWGMLTAGVWMGQHDLPVKLERNGRQ